MATRAADGRVVDAEADGGAERVADDEQRHVGHVLGEHVEAGDGVEALVGEVAAVAAGAGPEVEAQGGDARRRAATGTARRRRR